MVNNKEFETKLGLGPTRILLNTRKVSLKAENKYYSVQVRLNSCGILFKYEVENICKYTLKKKWKNINSVPEVSFIII